MTTSELIKQLQLSLECEGNLPVVLVEFDSFGADRSLVTDLEVHEDFTLTEYNMKFNEYFGTEVLPKALLIC